MAQHDRELAEALPASGAQVVLAEHLEQAGPQQARHHRGGPHGQGESGQQHAGEPLAAGHGQQAQTGGEQDDEEVGEEEAGHRRAQ